MTRGIPKYCMSYLEYLYNSLEVWSLEDARVRATIQQQHHYDISRHQPSRHIKAEEV